MNSSSLTPAPASPSRHAPEGHRSVQGGAARAAVFGVSDGLVTNVSLVIGMAGAHPAQQVVQLDLGRDVERDDRLDLPCGVPGLEGGVRGQRC